MLKNMNGVPLLKNLIAATGLPEDVVEKELTRLISAAGKRADQLTLDELRELLAEYLQEVLVDAKNEYSI